MLRTLCYAFIQPHIDYGLINWDRVNKTTLNSIKASIRKAVRVVAFKEKYDEVYKKYPSASPLFHKLNILNFDDHYKLTTGKLTTIYTLILYSIYSLK